jgi:hypothetical protein
MTRTAHAASRVAELTGARGEPQDISTRERSWLPVHPSLDTERWSGALGLGQSRWLDGVGRVIPRKQQRRGLYPVINRQNNFDTWWFMIRYSTTTTLFPVHIMYMAPVARGSDPMLKRCPKGDRGLQAVASSGDEPCGWPAGPISEITRELQVEL